MSRVVLVNATQGDVLAMCTKHNAPISVIEPLKSGGTRVVLRTGNDAAVITRAYRDKLIVGDVQRMPTRMR